MDRGSYKPCKRGILGWRQACDMRGLSQLQRCKRNYQMLNFVLKELIPWATDSYDFSHFEVNRFANKYSVAYNVVCCNELYRSVSSVCGFTREVLSALAADIETREWRRCLNDSLGPEHPRSSTSDDVECFFSVMRDMVGMNFTVKQAQIAWRKVCIEFQKRIDDTLPFYYFTSSHDRFYEVSRPSFDKPPKRKKDSRRLPRSEQVIPASLSSGRATLPVRGTLTIRPRFHKGPVHVPPPSTSLIHTVEHSYSRGKT